VAFSHSDMGGTIVLPGTMTSEAHASLASSGLPGSAEREAGGRALIASPSSNAMQFECRAGDVLLMDSRVLHCGGANTSDLRRYAEKRCFWSRLYTKMTISPRQARDKHRQSTQKQTVFVLQAFALHHPEDPAL
jgi:ectoine hydroxylase-related dioxygenase (phytanoyl-CoA dioxygenase family)